MTTIIKGTKKTLPDWFIIKNGMHDGQVLAILKESEKAVYAIWGDMFGAKKTTWIPKSIIEDSATYKADQWGYLISDNWEEAMFEIRLEARCYA